MDVVIPVWNEGENIVQVLESLRAEVKTPMRFFIVYDHDDDTTLSALKGYNSAWTKIVLLKNRYKGAHGAVVTGFETSTAPAVLVFPADDTFNAGIVDKLYETCMKGADIVACSRFMRGGKMEGCPWLKAVLVRTVSFTLYWLARIPTHDATSGFRMFSRRVIDRIPIESNQGFTFSLELLVKCHRLRWPIAEIPAVWIERKFGKSRFQVMGWARYYLRWYFYAFSTTFLLRSPATVQLR